MRQLPSGTVTFLFTDIEGSTRLLHELGDGYGDALAAHRDLVREAFAAHGGVEVDTQGDAFFYAFTTATDAVLILSYVPLKQERFEEALELADRSAALAAEVGWRWWESGALGTAAECALKLERPEDARDRLRRALVIEHEIGARQSTVFSLALLAGVAAELGEAERAGRLWGAVEAEAERGRVGQWEEGEREEYARHVAIAAGPEFDRGFREGSVLPLERAVEYALSVDSPT